MAVSVSPSASPSISPSVSISPSASPSAATAEASMMKPWGYRVTGDVGLVTVTDKTIYVKSFIFTNSAKADTCTITDIDGNGVIVLCEGVTNGTTVQIDWNARIKGLKVTNTTTTDVLNIIIS